ncbi:hypothetical protein [Blastococcus deserti]|uniref:Glycosyltransferase n=1 Tax=Blastococcus deserti TaxID=2259033 RepID=A0ABW4X7Y7_9ACTN
MTAHTAPAPPPVVVAARHAAPAWHAWRAWVVPVGSLLAFALWLWSLRGVELEETGGWGLLTALPGSWYAAFALTVLVHLWALLSRRPVSHLLVAPQVLLVAILFATTALVYDVPRYPWTYKHIGVVEYLLANGTVDRSIDIYHNFPGFFYLAAGLHRLTGIPVQDVAQWAQPTLALVAAAAVYWVLGGLTTSRRIRYGGVLLYTLGDWIGQNYFAPQALAFPVALFVLGGLLRSVPPGIEGMRFARLAERFPTAADDDLPRPSRFWRSRWGAVVMVVGFVYVVVSHPLSPMLLLAQSTVVCVLLRPARPWLPVVFLAIEEAWLLQAWPFLHSTYDLFDFGFHNVAPPTVPISDPLEDYETALWGARLLMVMVALLTVWGVLAAVAWRGRAGRMVVPLGMVAVPLALVLGQPYGNEGIFRAYLFALPWLAFVIALQLFDGKPAWTPERRLLATLAGAVMALLALPANFASELSYSVAASDVAAGEWFEEETPEGSVLLPFAFSFPVWSTADYPHHLPRAREGLEGIAAQPGFPEAATDETRLLAFTRDLCAQQPGTGPVYVAVGPSADDHVRLFGVAKLYVYRAYVHALETDPAFTPVFAEGQTRLFRCRA